MRNLRAVFFSLALVPCVPGCEDDGAPPIAIPTYVIEGSACDFSSAAPCSSLQACINFEGSNICVRVCNNDSECPAVYPRCLGKDPKMCGTIACTYVCHQEESCVSGRCQRK